MIQKPYMKYIDKAKDCEALSLEQRIKISKSPEFQKLDILVTRPSINQTAKSLLTTTIEMIIHKAHLCYSMINHNKLYKKVY